MGTERLSENSACPTLIMTIKKKKFRCIFISLKSLINNPFIYASPFTIIVITSSMPAFSTAIFGKFSE